MTFGSTFGRVFSPTFKPKSQAAAVGVSLTNFFNQLYSGTRNNHNGDLGFVFKPSRDIVVKALGRAVSTSIAANHIINVWRASDKTIVCTVTVGSASAVDSLGYAFEMLSSPVTLSSGAEYRIVSSESSGGDKWFDYGVAGNHLSSAGILYSVYNNSTGTYPNNTYGGTNNAFVVPTFYE